MGFISKCFVILANNHVYLPALNMSRSLQHRAPIVDLYHRTTGIKIYFITLFINKYALQKSKFIS